MSSCRTTVAATVLVILLSLTAFAQDQSEVGLFIDDSDLTTFNAPFVTGLGELHMVVLNPYFNTDDSPHTPGTEPVVAITGYDGRIEISTSNFILISLVTPVQGINIIGLPDFIVGVAEPMPVVDGQVTIGTFSFFGVTEDDVAFYLKPCSASPTYPGHMAAAGDDADENSYLFMLYPISGDHDMPVFIFNPTGGGPVATEDASWSGVKALYR